ncbi:MAG: hypothetical protein E6H03_04670 [Bacillati bacterium ANGP1]|uniref:Uncharacterized protein n=1 Tax=Candidatus Segetimicrobium genomatis TaxID=2569760 RepID=A0A537JHB4_9BACT|nr:MAG: hypothetical protein E6H03_04670 [Terrabacteria group bacterium ANGP1]
MVEKETTPGLVGRLATSRSGRDAGVVYVVIASEDLELGGTAPAALVEKLAGRQSVTDEDIRAAVSAAAPSVAAE